MHEILNHEVEINEQKLIKNRDFYSILKVDVHVHHSQCMSSKMLLDFMKEKFLEDEKKIVYKEGN